MSQGQYAASYYENNIVYAYNRNGNTLWWQNDNQRLAALDAASSVFDYNTYVDHYEDDPIFGDNDSFSEWKARGRDLHSTCDQTSLKSGETEKLFYNDTKQDKTFDLGSNVYRDIDGNTVTGKLTLKPFMGKILIGTTFDNIGSDNQAPVIQNQTFEIVITSYSIHYTKLYDGPFWSGTGCLAGLFAGQIVRSNSGRKIQPGHSAVFVYR